MYKAMLSGVSSLIFICGAFAADARSSDEEDSPQASTRLGYTDAPHRSSSGARLQAGRKPDSRSYDRASSGKQEDNYDGGY
jgi:hypothetical protein